MSMIRSSTQLESRMGWTCRPVCWICAGCCLMAISKVRAEGPAGTATNATDTVSENPAAYKKLSLEQLMDLDVTSVSKAPEPYGQAPAAIEVITSDEIRRSGASSIPEALRLADNLDVAQAGSSGWAISARGFNSSISDKLLVLMDGRSVYTPLFSGVIWNVQDYLLADIDRIEVISGPGGTLWGANAVNGVINITSKSARDTQGLYVEAGGGNQLEDFTGVRYGGTLATNIYYRVYGKYFDRGNEVYADGKSAPDSWNRGQGGFRIDDEASPQNLLTLQGDFYDGHTDSQPSGEGSPPATGSAGGGNVIGRWTHTFDEGNDLSLQIYYDRTHLAEPFPGAAAVGPPYPPYPAIPAGILKDDLDTVDLDFQDRLQLGERNHVTWGLGYRFTHDVVQNVPIIAFLPATLDQNLYSGFVQDEFKLFEPLHLTVGSKVEHNDYTGYEYEPSARLQWNVTDKQMIWAAISRAVRTPSRFDRDVYEPNPAYGYPIARLGNTTFQSETLLAYELGYRAQISSKISGSLSAFYNYYDDLRSETAVPAPNYPAVLEDLYFQNALSATTYGFEATADYQLLEGVRLHAGYDLLKEHVRIGSGGDLNAGLAETADPQQQVFLRSSMDLPGHTELDLAGRWIDTVYNNNGAAVGDVPGYFELDTRLGWHISRNLEVSVAGQNLLHDHHAEAGYPGPTQEQIVRSVYGKVTWEF